MKEKLVKLIEELNHGLVGREETIKLSLLTLLAGENTVLFGPPGTAKSEISRRISQVIDNGEYFEYLLTKFTTPEEIFGPLSINELKQDRFKRNTNGYMPKSHTAFLDEIFKANSSILNSLLTIINEKTFHNGNIKEKAPLISLIGASNELPIDDSELNALYDRFLTRTIVNYVNDEEIDKLFDLPSSEFVITEGTKIDTKEVQEIKNGIDKIYIPLEIRELIKDIRLNFNEEFKDNKQEKISDRKLVKVLKILKVSAITNGRNSVDISDVVLLKHCLWNNPNNFQKIGNIIINNVKNNFKVGDDNLLESKNSPQADSKKGNFDFKGEGTESSPFLIEDEGDLIHMGSKAYTEKGYYFKQIENITISSEWHSIVNFIGSYDGDDYKIIDLNNALFDNISNTGLNNIILEKVSINGEKKMGGIVNKIVGGKCKINNCSVDGSVTSSSSYSPSFSITTTTSFSGGILGAIMKGNCEINNCNVYGSITSSTSTYLCSRYCSYSGGIVGAIMGGECEISNCNVDGSVSSSATSSGASCYYSYSGGIVGFIEKESCKISNCNVNGSVSSSSSATNSGPSNYYYSSYSGGIVGSIGDECEINNCNVNVNVNVNSYHSGGIAGEISGGSQKFKNNYITNTSTLNKKPVNSSDENSSDGKSLESSQFNEKFYRRLGWDLDNIWRWDKDKNKPILIDCGYSKKDSKKYKKIKPKIEKNELSQILSNNIWL